MKKLLLCITMMIVILTSAIAQDCIRILPGTQFLGPGTDGTYTLTINYETDGNKTLETVIKCGSTQIFTDCFSVKGIGTKVYNGLTCSSFAGLSAVFTRRTGSCNSATCGPDVLLGGGVLATKISTLYVKKLDKNTVKVFFNVAEDINTTRYDVKLSTDGINFKTRAIIFPDNTKAGKYEVTIKLYDKDK